MSSSAPYKYLLSLPERAIRSLGALSGGLLHELGNVALPASVRRTTLYRTMVEVALRFLIEEVGQVEGVYPTEGRLAENFILKRTASHGIELLGILAFHASPVWVLAALADATGGGRKLILEISEALKEEGLLEPRRPLRDHGPGAQRAGKDQRPHGHHSEHAAGGHRRPAPRMGAAQGRAGHHPAEKCSGAGAHRGRLGKICRIPRNSRARTVFGSLQLLAVSTVAHVPANVLWLSRAARSAMRRTGRVLGDAVLDHYTEALGEIARTGFFAYWSREFRPYLKAREQSARARTLTERLLNRAAPARPRAHRNRTPRARLGDLTVNPPKPATISNYSQAGPKPPTFSKPSSTNRAT